MRYRPAPLLVFVALIACSDGPSAPPIVPFTVPTNPYLAASTWPIFHRDSYAQHSSELRGIEASDTVDITVVPTPGIPIFTLFDGNDDILTVVKTLSIARLVKIDHVSLTVVDTVDIGSGGAFSGAYGYVDHQNRVVVAVGKSLQRWTTSGSTLQLETSLDLTPYLGTGEFLAAVMVRYDGTLLYAGESGTVGAVSQAFGHLGSTSFPGEKVSNGFTTDVDGGIYLVTTAKLRRLDWNGTSFSVGWEYVVGEPFTTARPGRLGTGSGTTPSLVMDDMVTVADDEQRMNLRVVRRAIDTGGLPREVCNVPVFDADATTDNAIVVAGRTLILEQNLVGYGGIARFDVVGDGCRRTWVSPVEAPSCVPTLSTASGLVYAYTKVGDDWSLTGLDLDTGKVAFETFVGTGIGYDNRYAAVTIGPNRRMFIGTYSGLVVFTPTP